MTPEMILAAFARIDDEQLEAYLADGVRRARAHGEDEEFRKGLIVGRERERAAGRLGNPVTTRCAKRRRDGSGGRQRD